jgi:hypothetical protein
VRALFEHLIRQLQALMLTKPSVIWMALATFALVLASGERTFEGMRLFTGAAGDEQQFGTIVSGLITFGLQIMMLMLSWRIGDAYATSTFADLVPAGGARPGADAGAFGWLARALGRNFVVRNWLLLLSFAACALVCVFFSFAAFYRGLSTDTDRAIVSKNAASGVARDIDRALAAKLVEKTEQIGSELTRLNDWDNYKKDIDKVVEVGKDRSLMQAQGERARQLRAEEQKHAEEIGQIIEASERRVNAAQADVNRLTGTATRLEQKLKEDEQALGDLRRQSRTNEGLIAAEVAEVAEAKRQRDAEETTGNGRRNARGNLETGKGQRWRDLDAAFNQRVNEKAALDAEKRRLDAQIEPIAQRVSSESDELTKAKLDLANAETKLKALTGQTQGDAGEMVPTAAKGRADGPRGAVVSAAEEAEILGALPGKFQAERTRDNWDRLAGTCVRVLDLLREIPEGRAKAEQLTCDPSSDLRKAANTFFELGPTKLKFDKECAASDISAMPFAELLNHARSCLHIAGLQDEEVSKLETRLDQITEEQDEKAHTFVRSVSAFWRRDKMAYIALAMALALDGLIVLSGIWGAHANAGQLTRSGEPTTAEMDEHAAMVMALETRPEKLRPATGWFEPPEVHKARLFLRNVEPFQDPAWPEFVGTISCAGLNDQERDAVNAVLAIGNFARPVDVRSQDGVWLVTRRLIHYVTAIAAVHDKLERMGTVPVSAGPAGAFAEPAMAAVVTAAATKAESGPAYWANAAAAARSGRPAESEADLVGRGFVDRAYEAYRDSDPGNGNDNDNTVVHARLVARKPAAVEPAAE